MSNNSYIASLNNSIETSIGFIFKSYEESFKNHITKTKIKKLSIKKIYNIENFDSNIRLPKSKKILDAYPKNDRPRGKKDLESVKYHIKLIKQNKSFPNIWIVKKNGKLILLDGAHRIVAHYLSNKKYIMCNVIIL